MFPRRQIFKIWIGSKISIISIAIGKRSLEQRRIQWYNIIMSTAAPKQYCVSAGIFLRAVGALYFVSFFHLSFQVIGLIGENGISPAERFLERISDFTFEKESQILYWGVL